MKSEVREFTGYASTKALSSDGLDTALSTAKRHLSVEKGLPTDYVWYEADKPEAREALFWYTCLFSKVETGEIDAQPIQAGAVDLNHLSADETAWLRNAKSAKRSLRSTGIIRSASPSRSGRVYEQDDTSDTLDI